MAASMQQGEANAQQSRPSSEKQHGKGGAVYHPATYTSLLRFKQQEERQTLHSLLLLFVYSFFLSLFLLTESQKLTTGQTILSRANGTLTSHDQPFPMG